MIRTLIIEDEEPAALRLEKLLMHTYSEITVIEKLDSIESSVKWLEKNPPPDLILLDIQLADGLSFEIFKKTKVDSFIIFTTAYDEYAIQAFELNSIDYLLKPINKEKLASALQKFHRFANSKPDFNIDELLKVIEEKKSSFKKRFAINFGNRIKSVETDEISYFYSLVKNTFVCTFEGNHYPVDFSLDKLEELLSTENFFRINRQYIVHFKSIEKIHVLSKSRLEIEVKKSKEKLLVSTAKSHQFREWIDK
jgi:DNA-binding LytR/AlgR family response regulator